MAELEPLSDSSGVSAHRVIKLRMLLISLAIPEAAAERSCRALHHK